MHLESLREQRVQIAELGLEVHLASGETIRTEMSHKYTRESVGALLDTAGFRLDSWETDRAGYFALALARRSD
jgi:uncharacterized SAM-dependent methyltransferase